MFFIILKLKNHIYIKKTIKTWALKKKKKNVFMLYFEIDELVLEI